MRFIQAKCPKCAADLKINLDLKMFYCQHCGAQVLFDDGIKKTQHERIVIDQARLRELEFKEQKQKIKIAQEKQYEKEKIKWRKRKNAFIIVNIIAFAVLIFLCYLSVTTYEDKLSIYPFTILLIWWSISMSISARIKKSNPEHKRKIQDDIKMQRMTQINNLYAVLHNYTPGSQKYNEIFNKIRKLEGDNQ